MTRLEAIVTFLIPPACREGVAGDLRERNLSDSDYLAEAVVTVPMVVWSRIRRTTDARVLLLEGLILYACFLFFARGAGTFMLKEWAFVRLAVPVIVALWVLVLVDAYAAGPKRSPLYPVRDAVLGLMVAGLTWSVPVRVMLMGGGMSVLLVSALRMLFPPDENRPRGAT
jgi:hypothetical protein